MSVVIQTVFSRQILTYLLFITLLLVLPFILIFAGILYTIRWGLTLYKNWFMPDYGDFLSGMSAIHLVKSAYNKKDVASIVITYYELEGHLDLEDFQNLVKKKLSDFQREKPEPYFPELFQYLTTWAGFPILRNERDFQIDDHVRRVHDVLPDYEDTNVDVKNEDEVTLLLKKLSEIPFPQKRSPWDFLIHEKAMTKEDGTVNGNKRTKTILVGRFHHALCDGLSYITFVSHLANVKSPFDSFTEKVAKNAKLKVEPEEKVKRSNYLTMALTPIHCLYDLSYYVAHSWDDNVWHRGTRWPKFRTKFRFINLDKIPIERMRRIRSNQKDNPGVFNILTCALTGACRKYLIRHKLEVPAVMHTAVTIPIPKRTIHLSNNVTSSIAPLPTGVNDRREILRIIQQESIACFKSWYPIMCTVLFKFLGLLPESWKEPTNFRAALTMISTNVPTFDEHLSFCGIPAFNIHGLLSPLATTAAMYMTSTGYDGKLFVNLGVSDDNYETLEDLKEIRKYFQEEMQALESELESDLDDSKNSIVF